MQIGMVILIPGEVLEVTVYFLVLILSLGPDSKKLLLLDHLLRLSFAV